MWLFLNVLIPCSRDYCFYIFPAKPRRYSYGVEAERIHNDTHDARDQWLDNAVTRLETSRLPARPARFYLSFITKKCTISR